jgi:hypothetical protein
MLAEHSELLGQITVQARQLLEARLGEDALLEPALERVRATTGQFDVEPVTGSPACTRVSRMACSWASSGPCSRCTSVAISIMLWVISGVTTPGKGLRRKSSSRSLALLERS